MRKLSFECFKTCAVSQNKQGALMLDSIEIEFSPQEQSCIDRCTVKMDKVRNIVE